MIHKAKIHIRIRVKKMKKAKVHAKKVVKRVVHKLKVIKKKIVKTHKPAPKKLIIHLKLKVRVAKKVVRRIRIQVKKARAQKKVVIHHVKVIKRHCVRVGGGA